MYKFVIIFLTIVWMVNYVNCDFSCFHKRSNKKAVCKYIYYCDSVEEYLKNNIAPQICGVDNKWLLVCCPAKPNVRTGSASPNISQQRNKNINMTQPKKPPARNIIYQINNYYINYVPRSPMNRFTYSLDSVPIPHYLQHYPH